MNDTQSPPLDGIRVLELADESAVFAGRILADLGADIVRVEPPDGGTLRRLAPFLGDQPGVERGLYHLYHNANKRSVTLDMEHADGRALFRHLAATADALIETERLNHDELAALNPRLIHVSVTPFGCDGEWKDWQGNDLLAAAAGGLLQVSGEPGEPPAQGGADPAYKMAGIAAATAVMIALAGRDADPDRRGAYIQLSVQECARMTILEVANPNLLRWYGRAPGRPGQGRGFRCADGKWAGINVRPDRFALFLQWAAAEGVGTDLTADDWAMAGYDALPEDRARVYAVVEELAARLPRDAFVDKAFAAEQMCLPILDLPELSRTEHLQVNEQFLPVEHDLFGPLSFPRSPVDPMAVTLHRAPFLGEHNAGVYGKLGITAGELERLKAEGVI